MRAHCTHVGIQSEDMVTCIYCGRVLLYSDNPRPASDTTRSERLPAVGRSHKMSIQYEMLVKEES